MSIFFRGKRKTLVLTYGAISLANDFPYFRRKRAQTTHEEFLEETVGKRKFGPLYSKVSWFEKQRPLMRKSATTIFHFSSSPN